MAAIEPAAAQDGLAKAASQVGVNLPSSDHGKGSEISTKAKSDGDRRSAVLAHPGRSFRQTGVLEVVRSGEAAQGGVWRCR